MWITIEKEGRRIGEIRGGLFVTHRNPEHYFRIYKGFGINKETLEQMIKSGTTEIRLIYHGQRGQKVYISKPEDWMRLGKEYDNNGEKQIILSEREFERVLE